MASISSEMINQYDAVNSQALEQLVAQGTQLRPYPDDILQQMRQAAFDLYDEMAVEPEFDAVYSSWKAFRRRLYEWNRVNELSFARFSFTSPLDLGQ